MKHHSLKVCSVLGDRAAHIHDLSTSFMSQVLSAIERAPGTCPLEARLLLYNSIPDS